MGDILYMGWLYMIGTRILHPDAPRWPDMELLLYQDERRLFVGEFPKSLGEVGKNLDLACGLSAVNQASDRRSKQVTTTKNNLRRIDKKSTL